jgi:hypothetical protein
MPWVGVTQQGLNQVSTPPSGGTPMCRLKCLESIVRLDLG